METRNFDKDLKESNKEELNLEWEKYIKKIFGEDTIIKSKEECIISQVEFGCDYLIIDKKGRKYSIDKKGINNKYANLRTYPLEIIHHYYSDNSRINFLYSKIGWLYQSTADYILFGVLNSEKTKIIELVCFSLIPFKEDYFKSEISNIKKSGWASTQYSDRFQLTLNKIVTLDFLKNNAYKFWYFENEEV